jgi:iron-sulfur cluster repair protein YtfE (RIC family)
VSDRGGTELRGGLIWDESTRPSGPPPPDGHAYSRHGKLIGQHLTQVHDHLRAELSQVRELLEQVRAGMLSIARARELINEMTMRQNNWTLGAYCASYCAVVASHHGLEDRAVFPHLRQADPELAPVIDRLEAEHVVIHEVMQDVDRALVNLVSKPGDLSEVTEAIDVLSDTLLSHLAYEEREICEPLSRLGFYAGQL